MPTTTAIAAAHGRRSRRVAGRFEVVRGTRRRRSSWTTRTRPEALRRLLDDVRAMTPEGRVITVFGCGGDRDRAKRPEMGLVASTLLRPDVSSRRTIPAPRSPESIIDADHVRRGERRATSCATSTGAAPSRRALDEAAPGDVVVVAGKGHETTQTIGDLVRATSTTAPSPASS